jgi:phosphohistidine swiveling domain-containing protein
MKECPGLIQRAMELRTKYFLNGGIGIVGLLLLLGLAGKGRLFGTLVHGVETKTAETNRGIEALAERVRSDRFLHETFSSADSHELLSRLEKNEAGRAFLDSFRKFLDEYVHRETSLFISRPAWRDCGETVLDILRESPGSPGVATGPVRVVRGPHELSKLAPGDVLVAPVTNPSWTPLFSRAIAVVVDTGGSASHAAIVAREYGIPAVIGYARRYGNASGWDARARRRPARTRLRRRGSKMNNRKKQIESRTSLTVRVLEDYAVCCTSR